LPVSKDLLNSLIKNQRRTIKYHVFLALVVIFVGCSTISVSLIISDNLNDTLQLFLEIGGGFISTVSALSFNKVVIRLNRINTLTMFKTNFDQFTPDELQKVEGVFWDSIKIGK